MTDLLEKYRKCMINREYNNDICYRKYYVPYINCEDFLKDYEKCIKNKTNSFQDCFQNYYLDCSKKRKEKLKKRIGLF